MTLCKSINHTSPLLSAIYRNRVGIELKSCTIRSGSKEVLNRALLELSDPQ